MAEPPGKLLSSLTSPSDTNHPKLAGCAGAFFQLFDWNRRLNGKRLFRHKLLPAERPEQFSANHTDEKLPMAKLLLIAGENRGGYPMSSESESGETVPNEEFEIKPSKRTPGVVARLMGLETMPSPEPRRERKEDETNRFEFEYDLNRHMLQNRAELVGNADRNFRCVESKSARFQRKTMGLDRKPLEEYPGRRSSKDVATSRKPEDSDVSSNAIHVRRVTDRFQDPKPLSSARLPSLPPQQSDTIMRTISFPSDSHNKLVSSIRTPLASKRTARLFEAAGKVLKPRMQLTTLSTNFGIQSEVLELDFSDGEEEDGLNEASAPLYPKRMSHNSASSFKGRSATKSPSETSPDQKKRRVEQRSSPSLWHTSADRAFGSRQDGVMHGVKTQVRLLQEKKPLNAGDLRLAHRNASNQQVANRRCSYLSSSQEAMPPSASVTEEAPAGRRVRRSIIVKEENASAQCKRGLREVRQATAGDVVSTTPDVRKQEQTGRKLCQPAAVRNQNCKRSGAKLDRNPSSPKGRVAQSDNLRAISPQLSRVSGGELPKSSNRVAQVSSELVASSVNSNSAIIGAISYSRFVDNPKDKAQEMHNAGSKWMETAHRRGESSLMRSLLRRRAETEMMACSASLATAEQSSKLESGSICEYPLLGGSFTIDDSSESRDGATEHSSSNYDESFGEYESQEVVISRSENHRINFGSASCSRSSVGYVSDFVRHQDLHTNGNIEDNGIRSERVRARWRTCGSSAVEALTSEGTFKSSDVVNVENSNLSCCDFSLGNFRDTSSRVHPDVGCHRRESVSYSGKTTAAILQELLKALNSSRSSVTIHEIAGDKSEDSRISGTDSSSEAGISRQLNENRISLSGTTEYTREHNCHSADSVAVSDSISQETRRMSGGFKNFSLQGGSPLEESESVSDSLCAEDCGQPSPVSILESPFQYESSNSSDSFESTQGRKRREGDDNERFECTSTMGSQTEDGDSAESRGFGDCDELIDTISRLHHIDPSCIGIYAKAKRVSESEEQYVKEILGAAKVSPASVTYSGQSQLSVSFVDQDVFNKFEEQVQRWEWGICCPEEDDTESTCRSEMESHYEEAAALHRKLIFDCVSDALRLIFLVGRQVSGLCSQPRLHCPTTYLSRMVNRQMDEWKGMACSMNVDTMVEKEMNTVTGSWGAFWNEELEIAVAVERNIFRGLIEELVTDLSKSLGTKWVGSGRTYVGTKTVSC